MSDPWRIKQENEPAPKSAPTPAFSEPISCDCVQYFISWIDNQTNKFKIVRAYYSA
jgi:hypothetical protein